jgi:hypothetical protein
MDWYLVGLGVLAAGLLAARLLVLAWQVRGARRDPLPSQEQALERAKREARELQEATKAEPRRQLDAARGLGDYRRARR